jgi:hypothetical protein
MGIDINNLMPQLSPIAPVQRAQPGSRGMEREKLKLMKQQFEEAKRANLEEERLRRISEAGEMRRAEMAMEREQAQAAAQLAAQQQQQQLQLEQEQRKNAAGAYGELGKAQDANDFAGMAAAGERLRQYGGQFQELGRDEQGRPKYRALVDGQGYDERVAQRDQVSREMMTQAPEGSVWLPKETAETAKLSRLGALGLTGLDQEGVIDMGAQAEQRRAQAGPMLESLRMGLPEGALQESAGHTNEAALRAGLSPTDTAKLALEFRKDAGGVVKDELTAERDFQKEELKAERDFDKEMRAAKTDAEKQAVIAARGGRTNAATQWRNEGLNKAIEARKAGDQVVDMLSNKEHLDDRQVAHLFTKLKGSIGAQSDKEIDAVFGTEDMSLTEWGWEKFRNWWAGGVGDAQKQALIGIVERSIEMDAERVFSYLDSMESTLESPETSEEAKRGWRQFRDSIPEEYRKSWDADRAQQGLPTWEEMERDRVPLDEPGAKATPAANLHEGIAADDEFMDVFSEHAINAGIDPEMVLPLINFESGGNPQAANKGVSSEGVRSSAKGLIQFLDETAQEYGFKDSAEFASLSAAEQAPYVIQYLVDRGIDENSDQGDIYVAISAPGVLKEGNDAVAYRKDADTPKARAGYELNAKHWDLDKDGKITRGELHKVGASRGGKKKPTEGKPAAKPAAGKTHKNAGELDALME